MRLIAIGKSNLTFVKNGIDLYLDRLQKQTKFDYIEIPFKAQRGWNEEQVKKEEEKKFKQIIGNERLVLLDVQGKMLDSIKFASFIEKERMNPIPLCMLIGGPFGFSDDLSRMSAIKLSFGPMTFSHQIFRVMALEQIYRANTIINGQPYHHA